jgi:aspartyl-tRNA synthetase
MMRTHNCGELRKSHIGKKVLLCGWVQSFRDHGGVIFIDLRDKNGLTQIVFDPSHDKKSHDIANGLRREFVIQVEGSVRSRGDLVNPKLDTGEIEVLADKVKILNRSETPAIDTEDFKVAKDDLRLKFRYLDLRRPTMQKNLYTRHRAMKAAFNYLDSQNFTYVETPMLMKSTPEGARDYVVPSRVNMGKFYALPQSPQLYKQILMVSGVDRYFQFARCLRDEDLRADRQPEHTQIDLEMSFVEREDVFELVEGLMASIWKETIGVEISTPFPRLAWKEAMDRYGSDKPDLRFGLEFTDVTEVMKHSDFQVYKTVIEEGGIVKCMRVPNADKFSRNDIDQLIELAKTHHVKGLSWAKIKDGKPESSIVKYFSDKVQQELVKATQAKDNDLLLFVADKFEVAAKALGQVRLSVGEKLGLIDKTKWKFAWIIDFPLFEWNKDEEKWDPMHHMFCSPKDEDLDKMEKDPGSVLCNQYDLTLNGVELCSGSIRITDPEIQKRVMNIVGFPEKDAQERFGFLLEAFKYGAPPHGGVGLGFDRIVAIICGYSDIREVIAFPKNKDAECPMDGSPSEITEKQMKELHIKLDFVKKKSDADKEDHKEDRR